MRQARAAEEGVGNPSYFFGRILFVGCVIVISGIRSFAPREILRWDAPGGSVRLGRALLPCGVESEPYALPESCADRSEPGALCVYF